MPKSTPQLALQSLPDKSNELEQSHPTDIKLKDVETCGLLRAQLAVAEVGKGAALRQRDRLIERAATVAADGTVLSPLIAQSRDLHEKLQAAAQDLQDTFDAWESSGLRFQETVAELYAERDLVLERKAHISERCSILRGSVSIAQESQVNVLAEVEELVASNDALVHEQHEAAVAARPVLGLTLADANDNLRLEGFSELAAEREALAAASVCKAEAIARRDERCARAAVWQNLYDKSKVRASSQQAKADRAVKRSAAAEATANEARAQLEAFEPSLTLVFDQTNAARCALESANRLRRAASAVFTLAIAFALVKLVPLVL